MELFNWLWEGPINISFLRVCVINVRKYSKIFSKISDNLKSNNDNYVSDHLYNNCIFSATQNTVEHANDLKSSHRRFQMWD